ncbi:hypothetical protein SAMN00777080_3055 [Aquiflexum balticum DSM 16537]|uniref:Uncharacterized protein n=1 Tax=Aquiflexum balticum DSM 16537 TaxID=758820 RepID=A0A1W2H6P9_9BACT|nr:hypothetical protein SAMN00777080_3055 [Aquiflexum balticum DSM 16537]
MKYYVVKYFGQFGFIKPWTAVRDSETFSQQFLTPSIVEGIEKKLFPELLNETGLLKIKGHRLSYSQITNQQEVIQTRGWNSTRKGSHYLFDRPNAIIMRGLLHNPQLYLAFENKDDAQNAFSQHICLCRNEDILFPQEIVETTKAEFESNEELFAGYELVFEKNDKSLLVGYHRITQEPMYGWIRIVGQPVNV